MADNEIITAMLRQIIAKQEQMESEFREMKAEVSGLKNRQQQTEEVILARLNDTRPFGIQPEILQRLDRIERKIALVEKALTEMAGRDLELRSRVGLLESQLEPPKAQ